MPIHRADGSLLPVTPGAPSAASGTGPIPPIFVPEPVLGLPGKDAFSELVASFVMPPGDRTTTVLVSVKDGGWVGVGQAVFIENAGMLEAVAVSGNILTLVNLGSTGNASQSTVIPMGSKVSPGGIGASGGGGGGGPSYIPLSPPPPGTVNNFVVDALGNTSWQPAGGYEIDSFAISGTGVAPLVEVGTTQAAISWAAVFNFIPTSITVTCTGRPTQTPTPSGESSSGSFTGPFTSIVNGATITVSVTAIDPSGTSHTMSTSMTYAVKIVWGSVTSPIPGQGLWGQLNSLNNVLDPTLNATMGFSSSAGQQQAFSTLHSLGGPTLRDSGGDEYPPTFLGSSLITENGTSQQMDFYTVGAPGIAFTWIMS